MMRPGANGSAATLSSTKTKRENNGNEIQSEAMVTGADQEPLAPRSNPRSRRIIAATSKNAPKKSTRRSLVFQSDTSCLGSFKTRATLRKAAAQIGAWARNALGDISVCPYRKATVNVPSPTDSVRQQTAYYRLVYRLDWRTANTCQVVPQSRRLRRR